MSIDFAALVQTPVRDTFGEEVTYTSLGYAARSVTGIFTAVSLEADAGGLPVLSDSPTLGVKLSDLAAAVNLRGDLVTVRGVSYRVADCSKDGEGMARLLLQRTS